MNLQQLRTFILIAELGSLSKASDRMRIAQPALSRQMKLMQEEVGVALFDRHHGGMRLTSAGEEMLRRVPGLIRQLDLLARDAEQIPQHPKVEQMDSHTPRIPRSQLTKN